MSEGPAGGRAGGRRSGTADEILDVAEALSQTRGFNGFSYADISAALGITKASIHYHFRTKADLGRNLVGRYVEAFMAALDAIDESSVAAPEKLTRYSRLYLDVVRGERMCLCGMLAAEHATLPGSMAEEIRRFFDLNEVWLARVVEQGRADGSIRFAGSAGEVARLILGTLEGAMLVARPFADATRFESSVSLLFAGLAPTGR